MINVPEFAFGLRSPKLTKMALWKKEKPHFSGFP